MAHSKATRPLGLTQVWPTDDRKTVRDVVAIHGLDTYSPRTWVAFENDKVTGSREVHWLKDMDMLPAFIGDSRIFTYDWNANTFDGASNQYFHTHAEQFLERLNRKKRGASKETPIIFIASCYGGLVLAKAFTIAASLRRYTNIYQSTAGIIFLGTPFRGSEATGSAQKLVTFASLYGNQTSRKLLDVLNDERLSEIRTHFCDHAMQKWGELAPERVVCFYETEPTRISRAALPRWAQRMVVERGIQVLTGGAYHFVLVDSDSACLEGFSREAVNVRHAMLNKFRGRDDNFDAIVARILEIVKALDPPPSKNSTRNVSGLSELEYSQTTSTSLTSKEQSCLQCLRLSDYGWYKDRIDERLPGTCLWCINHPKYKAWTESASGVLLVSADPGCGKSVLARYLVDNELVGTGIICYFFFKDMDQNTSGQALSALLHQLLERRPDLLKHAIKQYEFNGDNMSKLPTVLWDILIAASSDPDTDQIICVVDALDECALEDMKQLVQMIRSHFMFPGPQTRRLKFLLTARPYETVTGNFDSLEVIFPAIRIRGEDEGTAISQEISFVVQHRIRKLGIEKMLPSHIENHLRERMMEIQHRTYLWMHLVFDYLQTSIVKKTLKGIDTVIAKLPETVEAAYTKLLGKSHQHAHAEVRRALLIITGAYRPLSLHEFNTAMNITPDTKRIADLDLENDNDFKLRIRDWCGLFISIHEEKAYLIHQTAREFLLSSVALQSSLTWLRPFTLEATEMVMAEACIVFLGSSDAIDDLKECNEVESQQDCANIFGSMPARDMRMMGFRNYAAAYWPDHIRSLGHLPSALKSSYYSLLHRPGLLFGLWFKTWASNLSVQSGDFSIAAHGTTMSLLSLQALMGHFDEVRRNISTDIERKFPCTQNDNPGSDSVSPLYASVLGGHLEIANLLLDNGANPNDASAECPLLFWLIKYDYSRHGRKVDQYAQLFEKLVSLGGNIQGTTFLGASILHCVKDPIFVPLACRLGADVNARYHDTRRTPLHMTVYSPKLVRALVAEGANVTAVDAQGQTPLHYADNPESIVILVKAGCPLEIKDDRGRTPLWSNAHDEECCKTLLQLGAGVNSTDTKGRTPLFQQRTRTLILHGADIERRDKGGKTPLMVSASDESGESMEILLEAGADINAVCLKKRTALHYVCLHRRYRIRDDNQHADYDDYHSDSSMEHSAGSEVFNWNDTDEEHHYSEGHDSYGIEGEDGAYYPAKEYQEHADQEDEWGGFEFRQLDPLDGILASEPDVADFLGPDGADQIMILTQRGASVNARDYRGDTPLHCLCRASRYAVKRDVGLLVRQLISAGADLHMTNNEGKMPIHVALDSLQSNSEMDEAIQVLRENGAEFDQFMEGRLAKLLKVAYRHETKTPGIMMMPP